MRAMPATIKKKHQRMSLLNACVHGQSFSFSSKASSPRQTRAHTPNPVSERAQGQIHRYQAQAWNSAMQNGLAIKKIV